MTGVNSSRKYLPLALALAALLFVSEGAAAKTMILAVSSSRAPEANLEDLKYPQDDVDRFVRAMTTVGNVPTGQIHVLQDPSLAELNRTIKKLERSKFGRGPGSHKFVFYFSGHSTPEGLYLRDALLPKNRLHNLFVKNSNVTKMFFLDSCFSGSLSKKGLSRSKAQAVPRLAVDEPSGSVFLAASSDDELAFESEKFRGGVFSHYLINGIYGDADLNDDSLVTIDELYQFVYRETKLHSIDFPRQQNPEFKGNLKGRGALVVSYPAGNTAELVLARGVAGSITIAAAKGLLIRTMSKLPQERVAVKLPPGEYQVAVSKSQRVGKTKVELSLRQSKMLQKNDFSWRRQSVQLAQKGDDSAAQSLFLLGAGGSSGYGKLQEPGLRLGLEWSPILTQGIYFATAVGVSAHRTVDQDQDLEGQTYLGEALLGLRLRLVNSTIKIYATPYGGATYQSQQITRDQQSEALSALSPTAAFNLTLTYHRIGLGIEPSWTSIKTVDDRQELEFATKASLLLVL